MTAIGGGDPAHPQMLSQSQYRRINEAEPKALWPFLDREACAALSYVHAVHTRGLSMASKAKGIRISDALDREIERESEVRGKSWSSMTAELLEEAIRMRRAPGVLFVDGPAGRRAVVAGTGLDVWEIVATWREGKMNEGELRRNYPWLTEPQVRAALAYYELYPQEIDARLDREARWTPERVQRELPFAHPRPR